MRTRDEQEFFQGSEWRATRGGGSTTSQPACERLPTTADPDVFRRLLATARSVHAAATCCGRDGRQRRTPAARFAHMAPTRAAQKPNLGCPRAPQCRLSMFFKRGEATQSIIFVSFPPSLPPSLLGSGPRFPDGSPGRPRPGFSTNTVKIPSLRRKRFEVKIKLRRRCASSCYLYPFFETCPANRCPKLFHTIDLAPDLGKDASAVWRGHGY